MYWFYVITVIHVNIIVIINNFITQKRMDYIKIKHANRKNDELRGSITTFYNLILSKFPRA